MKLRTLLFTLTVVMAWPLLSAAQTETHLKIEARQLPVLCKTSAGSTQKVQITITNDAQPAEAVVTFDGQSRTQRLEKEVNKIVFEIPEVRSARKIKYTVTSNGRKSSGVAAVSPVRHWQVNLVQHTHTDIGYTRSQMEVLAEQLRYIDYALDYCDATDAYPEPARFRWTCETSWAVSEYLRTRPAEQIARLKKRVAEGRIELAAMYLNFDELPDEQTLAASLQPLRAFREAALSSEVAMQNDVNGIGWCFSEYFGDLGVKYVNMGTHGHRALICFDKPTVFWWESPSGKKILTYRAEHYHMGNFFGVHTDNFAAFEEGVLNYLTELDGKDYPYDIAVLQHSGYHTDNSPPSTRSCEMVRRWNEKYHWPQLRSAVASEFFKEVEAGYADKIETIRGAWPDWWTDGFASGAREAAVSRITHSDVIASQAGLSMAGMLGAELPGDVSEQIDDINNALLFYDEHTFGFSESVRAPYGRETWEQRSLKQSYAWEAFRRSGMLGEVAMGLLQTYVPKAETPSVAVFNALNWNYSGIAEAYIDHQIIPRDREFEITDHLGKVIAAQPGESRADGTYWSLYVKDVPALGYARFQIKVKDEARRAPLRLKELPSRKVENQWYVIDIDPDRGTLSGIYDKELGRQLLSADPQWQFGEFIYETAAERSSMERYRAPEFTRRAPDPMRFAYYQKGPIWDSYGFAGETPAGRESDNLSVEFRVFNMEKKIEVVYSLRKKAVTDPEAVYVSFPFDIPDAKIYLDVPGGVIEAGVDQIPGSSNDWYTVQNFAAARGGSSQVVMGSREIPLMQFGAINTGRYTAGATPQSTNMYSWPMNNYWVTNFNADQMGELRWSYFISSGADNSVEFATKFAWENRIPLLTRVLPPAAGHNEPLEPASVMNIKPGNLLLVSMKPVKGEDAAILQMREIGGKPTPLEVTSEKVKIRAVVPCDALGQELSGSGPVSFTPWESRFVKVSWYI